MSDLLTTDACGQPLPERCIPGVFTYPACYRVGSGPVLSGFQQVTRAADCTTTSVVVLDQAMQVVPGAVLVPCPAGSDCCDAGSLCSILQALPTQVPGVADTALFVTPSGCFLGVPGGGGGGFPGYGAPVSTACANAPGVSLLVARADHVHRSEVPVQDEGAAAGSRCAINFIGAGVSAVDNPGLDRVDITIPGTTFPLLAPDGACAAPSYAFASSPDSGMFYNGTAVVIGDDNCTDFIEIGASINITSAGAVTTTGASIATLSSSTITRSATGGISDTGASVSISASATTVALSSATALLLSTAASLRLSIDASGAWLLPVSPGLAGQTITSNGAGAPPTWQTPAVAGFATPTVAADAAAATGGAATTAIRSDAKLQVATGTPVTATGPTNSAGVASTLARSDHLHRVEVSVQQSGIAVGSRPTLNFTGGGVSVADNGGSDRLDITIAGTTFATPTVAADAAAATGGAATTAIRSDAKLQVATGTPVSTGTANSAGVASTLARSDHVHATSFVGMVFSRGATVLTPSAAINVIVWRAPFACTVTNVRGYRVGGTGATINARRNGTDNHLAAAVSLSSADTWIDGGAVQNTAYAAGDKLEIMLVTLTGSPTQVAVQVDYTRN